MKRSIRTKVMRRYQLYIMILLPIAYFIIFKYIPMYGAQIAFKKFYANLGIWGSPWVGLKNFNKFFSSYMFSRVLKNTLLLSFYQLLIGFPIPILFALGLNLVISNRLKKGVQMVTYIPHFISMVVMAGIIIQFLDLRSGIVNQFLVALGLDPVNFMGEPDAFPHIYVISHVWQSTGWASIIYLAALSSVSPELHEAAVISGASRMQRVRYIDFPSILPTVIIMLIMNTGRIMQLGFQKVLLLQTPMNLRTSEIIQTYVYKIGLASSMADFSYATAIGLFSGVINLILLISVNKIARRVSEHSLW
jgi:putative aldouronate transport system permease protein